MAAKQKILIVDDDNNIAELISLYLTKECFDTRIVNDGEEAMIAFDQYNPNLILLDLMLPGMDGYQVCREIRAKANVPIIMLSAKGEIFDKVLGLELGADDYIEKPFGTSELLARIRTAIRHTRTGLDNDSIAQSGKYTVRDLTIDYDKHHVLMRGEDVHLTLNEFKIVALLGKYAGKVLTYDFIIKELWGPKAKNDNQILRVNMANIRRKIEENPGQPKYIFTEVGVGYRMREGD